MHLYTSLITTCYVNNAAEEGALPPDTGWNGSARFEKSQLSYLTYSMLPGMILGTGDFTIEWFQWVVSENSFTRIFQQGTYLQGNLSLGVSIENGALYFWSNQSFDNVNINSPNNAWTHFAIARTGNTLKIYENGQETYTAAYNKNLTSTNDIVFGQDLDEGTLTVLNGYISNFRITKGIARYTSNFSIPVAPFADDVDTVLLLPFSDGFDDKSQNAQTPLTNNNVTLGPAPWPPA